MDYQTIQIVIFQNDMIFRKTIIMFLLSTFVFSVVGQESKHHYCGHALLLESNEKLCPGYGKAVKAHFDFIQKKLHDLNSAGRNQDILKIPVVVHIVWKNDEENLSDEIIQSQIVAINEDFRLLNPNKDSIRDIFRNRQADTGIEFELVSIKRVKTNSNFNLSLTGLVDNVKRAANGGSRAEDTEVFLNIWVCKIQPIPFIGGQILGYAYPPAGLTNWPNGASAPSPELDGVVIDFRAFGRNNPYPVTVNGVTIYSEGRTATHEIGHYLGLRHIWGDGGGIFGGLSCNEDDGIADTPNQGRQSSFDCNKSQNTCTDPSDDEPDMIENYMDYSDQFCQSAFTLGQAEHMRMVLLTRRSGLLSSANNIVGNNSSIYLTPNPVLTSLLVHLPESWSNNSINFSIRGMDGTLVVGQKNGFHHLEFYETLSLKPGLYILTLSDGNFISNQKFVKL